MEIYTFGVTELSSPRKTEQMNCVQKNLIMELPQFEIEECTAARPMGQSELGDHGAPEVSITT